MKVIAAFVPIVLCLGLTWGESKGSPEKGNELFDEQCSSCHFADKVEVKVGPGLKLMFAREKLQSNGKPMTDANVLEKIEKGGGRMPAFKDTLSADDKADLIAYLKTL
ncbi:MAG TPA: cytochrome c [Bryobacteraceae bacterium]|nr:cytochrome c [Bryobacteraceae bacterium]